MKRIPDISLVLPCFNEESAIRTTAPELIEAFTKSGVNIELILVDNGSTDRTELVIDELVTKNYPIRKIRLPVNQGYGGGILSGLKACEAPIVGYLCADGQVSAEDALMAYLLIRSREHRTMTKVRRRFRQDSWKRKIVSIFYNGLMQLLYGWLGAIDINGSPKIFSRETLEKLNLSSKDWFLDPEIIIKAKYLNLRIIEVDVEGHSRKGGVSHVNLGTCLEFIKNIVRFRFGGALNGWRQKLNTHAGGRIAFSSEGSSEAIGSVATSLERFGHQKGLNGVVVLKQKRYEDSRGFLQKVLASSQCNGNVPRGEVYVTSAKPGESKGNHYHKRMGEWFTVVQGNGEIQICDPKSEDRMTLPLSTSNPQTVYVPAGLAHSIVNTGRNELICIAWAENEHDSEDVYSFLP